MKTTLFSHKNIYRRKLKVTCSPERQAVEDRLDAEDVIKKAQDEFLKVLAHAEIRERIDQIVQEGNNARNNHS